MGQAASPGLATWPCLTSHLPGGTAWAAADLDDLPLQQKLATQQTTTNKNTEETTNIQLNTHPNYVYIYIITWYGFDMFRCRKKWHLLPGHFLYYGHQQEMSWAKPHNASIPQQEKHREEFLPGAKALHLAVNSMVLLAGWMGVVQTTGVKKHEHTETKVPKARFIEDVMGWFLEQNQECMEMSESEICVKAGKCIDFSYLDFSSSHSHVELHRETKKDTVSIKSASEFATRCGISTTTIQVHTLIGDDHSVAMGQITDSATTGLITWIGLCYAMFMSMYVINLCKLHSCQPMHCITWHDLAQ